MARNKGGQAIPTNEGSVLIIDPDPWLCDVPGV